MRPVLERYLRENARWGNWHLSQRGSALFNVKYGRHEFSLDDLDTVETLALRVRHAVTKSWCVGAESSNLCQAIEGVTGLGIYIRREGSARGPVRTSTPFQRALHGGEHVKVLVRDNGGEALNPALYQRLRRTFPR